MIETHVFGSAVTEVIIAADKNRDHITIQLQSAGTPVYLAFGEPAVNATGICLLYPGCSVRVTGAKARMAVNGIEPGDGGGVVGIETTEDVEYRPGSYIWF